MSYKLTLQKISALLNDINRRLDECNRLVRSIKNEKMKKSKSYESFFLRA